MKLKYLPLLLGCAIISVSAHAADAAKGKQLFDTLCASCHGPQGAGDGPVSAALPAEQKPRDLQEGNFKFATDDAKMKELIKKGGAAVGLSVLMPAQPSLSDGDLENLVAFIHSLKK